MALNKEPITLPAEVKALMNAREKLAKKYKDYGLDFTLDGKLVGDIGEAIVIKHFDLEPDQGNGVDAKFKGTDTKVQIKATGREKKKANFLFRPTSEPADHLIAIWLDYENLEAEIIYNRSEAPIREKMKQLKGNQVSISLRTMEMLAKKHCPSP